MAFGKVTNPKSESDNTMLTGRLKLPMIVHRRKSEGQMAHLLQRADGNLSFGQNSQKREIGWPKEGGRIFRWTAFCLFAASPQRGA